MPNALFTLSVVASSSLFEFQEYGSAGGPLSLLSLYILVN